MFERPTTPSLIFHRHRNPAAIVPARRARDLQPSAKTELQPAVGAKAWRGAEVGGKTDDARGAAIAAFKIDRRGHKDAHFGAGLATDGHDPGEREAAQIDDASAQAPCTGQRVDFDFSAVATTAGPG